MSWAFKRWDNAYEWQWMKERTHVLHCEDSQGIVAWKDNEIRAVVVADQFKSDTCSVHIAIDDPMCVRAGFLSEVAYHLFVVCGRRAIFGTVPSKNAKALKFDEHIGFKEVARISGVFGEGEDCVVMEMSREDCRWLPEELREAA